MMLALLVLLADAIARIGGREDQKLAGANQIDQPTHDARMVTEHQERRFVPVLSLSQ